MSTRTPIAAVAAIAGIGMITGALLLGYLLGPTDNGVRCERSPAPAQCQVLQTRFFGLFGNSSFTIPQASIRGAETECGARGVGGRRGTACAVYLLRDPQGKQLVASFALRSQADASTERVNRYLADTSATSVDISNLLVTPVLLYGVLPSAVMVLALALRLGLRRERTEAHGLKPGLGQRKP